MVAAGRDDGAVIGHAHHRVYAALVASERVDAPREIIFWVCGADAEVPYLPRVGSRPHVRLMVGARTWTKVKEKVRAIARARARARAMVRDMAMAMARG